MVRPSTPVCVAALLPVAALAARAVAPCPAPPVGAPESTHVSFERSEPPGEPTCRGSTGGVSWVDFDADGHLDLFVTNGYDVSATSVVAQQDRLYRNDGRGGLTLVTEGSLATGRGVSSGHTWGDYDGDGDLDVYITRQQDEDNTLLRNDGGGAFSQVVDQPPSMDGGHSYAASWVDVDRDGRLDLFVANGGLSHVEHDALYRGVGGGGFERVEGGLLGEDEAASCGSAWGDMDDDGDQDLFVARWGFGAGAGDDALFRNDDGWEFTRIVDGAAVHDGSPTSGATWIDVDNDLDLDLHVTCGYGRADTLYLNDGRGGLTPAPSSPLTLDGGHGYGASWADLDNDGLVDCVVANWGAAAAVYRNVGGARFERVDAGDLGARIERPGAIATGDLDADGRLDVVLGNWPDVPGAGEHNSLYRNTSPGGHWLVIRPRDRHGSPGGPGVRVRVDTVGDGARSSQRRDVASQHGFRGQSEPVAHFGLGDATRVERVEVRWPSGEVLTLTDLAADQVVELAEPGQAAR